MQYETLCNTYQNVEKTSKRLEKTVHIAQLLTKTTEQELEQVMLLLQGKVFSAKDKQTLGISTKLTLQALARVTGKETRELEKAWSEDGDLGLVAEKHVQNRTQQTLFSQPLTVGRVFAQLQKMPSIEGKGSVDTKLKLVSELLSQATSIEAKYLTRTLLEELRIGIAQGTLRDAIIYAFLADKAGIEDNNIENREAYNTVVAKVQAAYDRSNDFSLVAQAARKGLEALSEIRMEIGTPLKVMLGEKGIGTTEAMQRLGTPMLLQHKYDGFRLEIHKNGESVTLFTRRLENVTKQFPDVVELVQKHVKAETVMLDAEAIGIDPKTHQYQPFQAISQRIRRKYDIEKIAEELPVEIRVFDIMFLEGEEYVDEPLEERHKKLQEVIEEGTHIGIAQTIITTDETEAQTFYQDAINRGLEGVFAKNIRSIYQPGVRAGNWVKLKSTKEPVDLVVVAAEWGEGKRSGWLTSFVLACMNEEGELVEVGKAATGLKELPEEGFSFEEITKLLEEQKEYEEGKMIFVKPAVILEIGYEEIQKSPSYTSGYALRFPRIKRNRTDDKPLEEITPLAYIEQLYQHQQAAERR